MLHVLSLSMECLIFLTDILTSQFKLFLNQKLGVPQLGISISRLWINPRVTNETVMTIWLNF